jgi:FkbM family methyltransferase
VLDVGANRGQFGRKLRKVYSGKVMSFEPLPAAFDELRRAAADDPHWEVHNVALASRDGTQSFRVSESSEFSSFLETNEYCHQRFGNRAEATREVTVNVRRLDSLLHEVVPRLDEARIYLKLDTQGYDLEVFDGLGDTRKLVVALQTEVSLMPIYKGMPHWTESIGFFESAGFGVTGLFPVNTEALRVIEYDCTMVDVGSRNEARRAG